MRIKIATTFTFINQIDYNKHNFHLSMHTHNLFANKTPAIRPFSGEKKIYWQYTERAKAKRSFWMDRSNGRDGYRFGCVQATLRCFAFVAIHVFK